MDQSGVGSPKPQSVASQHFPGQRKFTTRLHFIFEATRIPSRPICGRIIIVNGLRFCNISGNWGVSGMHMDDVFLGDSGAL